MSRAGVLVLLAVAACGSFEDPNVVIDLRVLAMSASPPDQVLDVDLTETPDPAVLLAQIQRTEVCALVADPGLPRQLAWSMQACQFNSRAPDRCNPDGRHIALGQGVIGDPETTRTTVPLCVAVEPTPELLLLVSDILSGDSLRGLGGIDYHVVLRIGGELEDRANDEFAIKAIRLAPRIPAERTANRNPELEELAFTDGGGSPSEQLRLGHCADAPGQSSMIAGQRLQITPIETPEARETYTVPTLDGRSQTFTESVTYQWIASAGGFSSGTTGGGRDVAGNPAPIASEYRAPSPDDVTAPIDVTLWIIQRDERLGVAWYEACVRVLPVDFVTPL